jgi:hypothetical protein
VDVHFGADGGRDLLDRAEPPRVDPAVRPLSVHPAQPGLLDPGRLRSTAAAALREPTGRPRPCRGRARLRGQPTGPAIPLRVAPRRARRGLSVCHRTRPRRR